MSTDSDVPASDSGTTHRRPNATVSIGTARVSGWNSDKGWSFMASRSYRQGEETKFSDMTLYGRDLLNLSACLQRMAEHIMTVRIDGERS